MELIIGLCIGIVLFICCVKAYLMGLSHGKTISKGETPIMDINPIKTVINKVEQHKQSNEQDQMMDELDTLMNFNQGKALEAIKAKG
jgi:hypothetical protein